MKPFARPGLAAALLTLCSVASAATETFVIDTSHTKPRFEYSHFGYSTQSSRFDTVSGKISYDAAAHTAAVEVTIDARSVNTGSALFNEHIQGEDFFDTARHPTIRFKSSAVKFAGDAPVSIDGVLTIKGVTRAVTLTVTSFMRMPHPMLKRDAIGANATLTIKRSDFNAGKYAPHVSDEVTLILPVEAIKE